MIVYLLIAIVVFALDQLTKWLVKTQMDIGQVIPVLGEDFFALTSFRNRGAAFGILQGQQVFFLIITVLFLIGICWYLYRSHKAGERWTPIGLSLMLGGAVGNFLDRAIYGEVVDFLQFHFDFGFADYFFPIFNVADSGIVVGVFIILVHTAVVWRKESRQEASKAEETSHDAV